MIAAPGETSEAEEGTGARGKADKGPVLDDEAAARGCTSVVGGARDGATAARGGCSATCTGTPGKGATTLEGTGGARRGGRGTPPVTSGEARPLGGTGRLNADPAKDHKVASLTAQVTLRKYSMKFNSH